MRSFAKRCRSHLLVSENLLSKYQKKAKGQKIVPENMMRPSHFIKLVCTQFLIKQNVLKFYRKAKELCSEVLWCHYYSYNLETQNVWNYHRGLFEICLEFFLWNDFDNKDN